MRKFVAGAFEDSYAVAVDKSSAIARHRCDAGDGRAVADAAGVRSRGERHGNGRLATGGGKTSGTTHSAQLEGNSFTLRRCSVCFTCSLHKKCIELHVLRPRDAMA